MSPDRVGSEPPGETGARAQRASETRRRLVDAAAQLFASQGYAVTTVAAIGEAAGVSRGLVNFHFTSKALLLRAVIEELIEDVERDVFTVTRPIETPWDVLDNLIQAHRRFVVGQPERARLLFRLQAEELNPELGLHDFADLHRRWLTQTRPWWDAGAETGELDLEFDHPSLTTVVLGAMRGIALEWLLDPESTDIDRAYALLNRLLHRGLRSSGPVASAPS